MNPDKIDLAKKLLTLPWYNLILISLLVVPVFLGTWITLLSTLKIQLSDNQKKRLVLAFVSLYIVGLVVGKIGYDTESRLTLEKIKESVKIDLKANSGIMGFKRIRERHPTYTEDMLYLVAEKFPGDFEVTPIADPTNVKLRDPTDPFGLKLR